MSQAKRFFAGLQGKQVWFVGIGVSHIETIQLFAAQGLSVTACDKRSREEIGEALCVRFEAQGVTLLLGEEYPSDFFAADVLLRTPGMYYNLPLLQEYRAQGGILTSEMEIFCRLCPCPLIAVTGSDGKTTTTTLISEILKAGGKTVHLGGNIGKALLPEIFRIGPDDWAVVELSSFQLISMRFAPWISVVTNVTPNHLDVHSDMAEYTDTKRQVFAHQTAFSRTVLGADNEITASFAPEIRGECRTFSMRGPVKNGAYYNATDRAVYTVRQGGEPQKLMDASEIRLPGMHNIANYLAAISAVGDLAEPETIRQVARTFAGVEHRIEFVRERNGVRWYNDSIATSPTRAIAGLRSFDHKILLIAGGYDKKIPFEPLAPEIVRGVKTLILCGATAAKIESAVQADPGYSQGNPAIHHVRDIPEAVALADQLAGAGDVVSLSPACASFDAYRNFELRGQHFKELVHSL